MSLKNPLNLLKYLQALTQNAPTGGLLQAGVCGSCACMKLEKCIKMKSHLVFLSVPPRRPQREGCRAGGGGRMECSWKTVLLLVCASLGVQYTAIRTLRDSLSGPCQGAYRCHSRRHGGTSWCPTFTCEQNKPENVSRGRKTSWGHKYSSGLQLLLKPNQEGLKDSS